ncbi:IS1595 family transposase [Cohnella rhizosphaerae]|uniref:Transposase n=1 Tax=Cohnella rhizosphaerae TaxID=1457232 RepID=A0A9X4KNG9_9BACL|nr:IS1595 family transposase [Cohnella rhizosphaerae]MDG0808266.1 transposase [Cohnella rhizosphaerae]
MSVEADTYERFCQRFDSDAACAQALFALRWPAGFRCPACHCCSFSIISTRRLPLYQCASCRRQTSIISGTIMEGSRTPLPKWFQAIFLLSQSAGISALRLSDLIMVTYKTAWHIAHKIRFALQAAETSELIDADYRLDAFYYGSPVFQDAQQPLLIGAPLNERERPDRVVLHQPEPRHVDPVNRRVLASGYHAFDRKHAEAHVVPTTGRYGKMHNAIFPIAKTVCIWLNDTFNGIGAKHLQAYLDEFAFRLNKHLRSESALHSLLRWCSVTRAIQYDELTRSRAVLAVPWIYFGSRSRWKGRHMSSWGA